MDKQIVINEMGITLKVIGGKYKPLILHFLLEKKESNFSEIMNYLSIAPRKTIISQLKELEEDKIIVKEIISNKPYRVKYYLSELGKSLDVILEAMCSWGYKNKSDKYEIINPLCDR